MQILKQSTATTVYVGPVLDSAGAAVTTAVVGDFRIVKNGTAATLSGATVTHDANGCYTIALTTSNTDTVGRLTIAVGNTAMAMATHRYTVLLASVFDAIVTNATNATGGLLTATGSVTTLSGAISTLTASGVRTELATELGRIDAAVSSRMATYTQPAGFLAATFPTTVASTTNITTVGAVSGSVGSVTGNVGGNVVGSVGSISGVTFPTNFASLAINASGHISRVVLVDTCTANTDMRGTDNAALASIWTSTVAGRIDAAISSRSSHSAADVWAVATRTLTAFSFSVTVGTNNDKTGYSLATAPLDASGTAAAVWGALLASYTTAGTFGARILRTDSASAGNGAKVTGAGHVAADIHELQPAVITAADFAAGAIDANALAADAASEIASAVRTNLTTELARIDATMSSRATQTSVDTLATYVDTEIAAIKAKTDNLPANPAAVGDIPTAVAIADAVLSRSVTNVEASAGEHTLCTLILAGLESSITGATWTIRRTGGTTHYTKTVTTDSGAAPIVGVT